MPLWYLPQKHRAYLGTAAATQAERFESWAQAVVAPEGRIAPLRMRDAAMIALGMDIGVVLGGMDDATLMGEFLRCLALDIHLPERRLGVGVMGPMVIAEEDGSATYRAKTAPLRTGIRDALWQRNASVESLTIHTLLGRGTVDCGVGVRGWRPHDRIRKSLPKDARGARERLAVAADEWFSELLGVFVSWAGMCAVGAFPWGDPPPGVSWRGGVDVEGHIVPSAAAAAL
jgi:hypothetical protein